MKSIIKLFNGLIYDSHFSKKKPITKIDAEYSIRNENIQNRTVIFVNEPRFLHKTDRKHASVLQQSEIICAQHSTQFNAIFEKTPSSRIFLYREHLPSPRNERSIRDVRIL